MRLGRVVVAVAALLIAAGCGGGSGSDGGGSATGRVTLAKECPKIKKAIADSDKIPSPRPDDEITEYTQLQRTLSDIATHLSVADAEPVANLQSAASDRLDVLRYSDTTAADSVASIKALITAQQDLEDACSAAGVPIS